MIACAHDRLAGSAFVRGIENEWRRQTSCELASIEAH